MGPGHDALPSMYPVNMELGPAMMGMGHPAFGMTSIARYTVLPAGQVQFTGHSWNSYCYRQTHLSRSAIVAGMHRGDCTGHMAALYNPAGPGMMSKVGK